MSYAFADDLVRRATEGATNREIAHAIGKSEGLVSLYLTAYRDAGPELAAAWEEKAITDEIARALAKLPEKKQVDVLRQILDLPDRDKKLGRGLTRKIVYSALRDHHLRAARP